MGVSKTDFVRGLQCPKMLWLDSHRPEEKINPEEVQIKLQILSWIYLYLKLLKLHLLQFL